LICEPEPDYDFTLNFDIALCKTKEYLYKFDEISINIALLKHNIYSGFILQTFTAIKNNLIIDPIFICLHESTKEYILIIPEYTSKKCTVIISIAFADREDCVIATVYAQELIYTYRTGYRIALLRDKAILINYGIEDYSPNRLHFMITLSSTKFDSTNSTIVFLEYMRLTIKEYIIGVKMNYRKRFHRRTDTILKKLPKLFF